MPKEERTPKVEAEIGLRLADRVILVKRTAKGVPTFVLDDKTSQKDHFEIKVDTRRKFDHLWDFLKSL